MIVILVILSVLCVAYVLSTMCRKGHPGLSELRGWAYAHRGLHGNGVPENSMAAFKLAKEAGYGVELDVHLLSDGSLAVIHDSLLQRTTGASGYVEDLTADQLAAYKLEGTEETIPLFADVLTMFDGSVPLIVELKCTRNNFAPLCAKTCEALADYQGAYCLESFDPRCIRWLRKNRPELIRGQLTENYLLSKSSKLPWYLKFALTNQILNFLLLPDFVAYRFRDCRTLSNWFARSLWGTQGVTWTLRSQSEYDEAVKDGWIPIFENFRP